jgi:hypothetical protein
LETIACPTWGAFKEHMLRYAALTGSVRAAYIFRGHRDSEWKLESTLDRHFRQLNVFERAEKLKRLLDEFGKELYGIDGRDVIEADDRLELIGRHHGLPTTVLDWSKSPYVAAYFAFEREQPASSGLVSVLCFDRRQLSASAAAGDVLIDDMSLLGDNVRAIQQRGVFLRLPVGITGENALSIGLWKYTIPHAERTIALSDLDAMLITAKALFRDRDAAARTALIRESLP